MVKYPRVLVQELDRLLAIVVANDLCLARFQLQQRLQLSLVTGARFIIDSSAHLIRRGVLWPLGTHTSFPVVRVSRNDEGNPVVQDLPADVLVGLRRGRREGAEGVVEVNTVAYCRTKQYKRHSLQPRTHIHLRGQGQSLGAA